MAGPIKTQLIHMVITLFFMVGVIVLLAYLYKRFGFSNAGQNKNLKILSTLALGAKEKLILVQVGEQQLLLGATQHNITTLHELNEPIAVTDEQTLPPP